MDERSVYQMFVQNTDIAFEFQLAEHLHKSVAEIRELSDEERLQWRVYLGLKAQIKELASRKSVD